MNQRPNEHHSDPVHQRRALLAGIGGLAAGALLAGKAHAGPLSPPAGPIAPTPGPEPRIPIGPDTTPGDASNTYRITERGSYYLTGNIVGQAAKNGILINASNVSLDLMGFEVRGVTGSLDGIRMTSASTGIVVRNGLVSEWGGYGVRTRMDTGALEDLHCHLNAQWGIDNLDGFSMRVSRCSASFNNAGGIRIPGGSLIESCVSYGNTGSGIQLNEGSTITDCIARDNTSSGIFATRYCCIRGNTCLSNQSGIGVNTNCQVTENLCQANSSAGIYATGSGNFIARNLCRGNALNWNIAADNVYLIVQAVASGGMIGNAGGTSPGSTNPNANFTM